VEHPAAAPVVDDVPSVATSSKRLRGRPGTHQLNKLRRTLRTSLVSRKGGPPRLLPVVEQQMRVAEHLARQLDRLGLGRKARPGPSLAEYLGAKPGYGA
jgi:hypothetical protein